MSTKYQHCTMFIWAPEIYYILRTLNCFFCSETILILQSDHTILSTVLHWMILEYCASMSTQSTSAAFQLVFPSRFWRTLECFKNFKQHFLQLWKITTLLRLFNYICTLAKILVHCLFNICVTSIFLKKRKKKKESIDYVYWYWIDLIMVICTMSYQNAKKSTMEQKYRICDIFLICCFL